MKCIFTYQGLLVLCGDATLNDIFQPLVINLINQFLFLSGILIIVISGVNGNPPVFLPPWTQKNPSYTLNIPEEQPVGTIVATYVANDDESDISGYYIDPVSDYFKINNGTGIVQIKKQIDYEKEKTLNFTVVAYDIGVPQLHASAIVHVNVININDNAPIFLQKMYNASILENSPVGSHVISVKAIDLDAAAFGMVTYKLAGEDSNNFEINPTTGEITVANSEFLDHEIITETTINVIATDGASAGLKHTTSVPVHITITDQNDNMPKFNQSTYNITIGEGIRLNPPVTLVQVSAEDLDGGSNGDIRYRIVSGNEVGKNYLFLPSLSKF